MNWRQIYQHQSSPPRYQGNLEQKPLAKLPKAPWKFVWRSFVLTKLKPHQSVSFSSRMLMLHFSPLLEATEGLWMLKMQMSLNFLFHIQNQPNSGWRQSTHWTRELFLKNKQKTQNLVNSTSTPTAGDSCPNHLTPGWVVLSSSLWGYIWSNSSSDDSFPALWV